MKSIYLLLLNLLFVTVGRAQNSDPIKIVNEMMEAHGGKENFHKLKNVSFNHIHKDPVHNLTFINREVYQFNMEKSYAEYTEHTLLGTNGKVVEGYNGKKSWVTINGKNVEDEKSIGVAHFLRKANYYFFAMFFKLTDEGVNLSYKGSKIVEGNQYDLIKASFNKNIGDTQDEFIFYINKKTKLVDQFLFTVKGFGINEPKLMKLHNYVTIDGIKIATKRSDIQSNWNGDIVGEKWGTTTWSNIKFNQNIDSKLFEDPKDNVGYYSDYFVFMAENEHLVIPFDFNWSPTNGGYNREFKSWYGTETTWPIVYFKKDKSSITIPKETWEHDNTKGFKFNKSNRTISISVDSAPDVVVSIPEKEKWIPIPDQSNNKKIFAFKTTAKRNNKLISGWMIYERIRWAPDFVKSFGDFKAFYWVPLIVDGDFYHFEFHSGYGKKTATKWFLKDNQVVAESADDFKLNILETKKDAKSGRNNIAKSIQVKAPKWDIDISLQSKGSQVGYGEQFPKGLAYYRQSILTPKKDSKTRGYGMLELILEND